MNVVRIPLNEDCWLGINGVNPAYGGYNYQKAIGDFVQIILNHGMYVILDLHWTAAGGTLATKQDPMPNKDHSITFWQDCARYFMNKPNVLFDVFNEPFPERFS
jgi:aryl-phospho-beta-D-glucosidase BglC (GH1 family)